MVMAKKKVFVGLSGGVDSSVSAALLKKAGFDVTGVFIKAWHPDWAPCDWKDDRRDAMRVCAKLDIPFKTLDLEKVYKKEVVDYMVREYKAGRTPNPDVMCNKEVKFGAFLRYAKKEGADFVATGHYAQNKFLNSKYNLLISKDEDKDQSYFLWTLKQEQLKNILFPVGGMTKGDVRVLAKKFDLATAQKKDSQGLCFVGKIDMKDFLEHFMKAKKGMVLDSSGKKIGTHNGAMFLTIGQRHGFSVSNTKTSSGPLYIVGKDVTKNTITVSDKSPQSTEELGVRTITLSQVNWITNAPAQNKSYGIRLRYRQKLLSGTIQKKGKLWTVTLSRPFIGASVGQSLVVYDKGLCLGGGVIERAF